MPSAQAICTAKQQITALSASHVLGPKAGSQQRLPSARGRNRIPTGFNHSAQGWPHSGLPCGTDRDIVNPERVESRRPCVIVTAVSQSLAKIVVHTVFSTKDRGPYLRAGVLRGEMHC